MIRTIGKQEITPEEAKAISVVTLKEEPKESLENSIPNAAMFVAKCIINDTFTTIEACATVDDNQLHSTKLKLYYTRVLEENEDMSKSYVDGICWMNGEGYGYGSGYYLKDVYDFLDIPRPYYYEEFIFALIDAFNEIFGMYKETEELPSEEVKREYVWEFEMEQ